jgi:hypothetical protein
MNPGRVRACDSLRFPTVPLELAIPGNGKRHPGSNWVASMIDIGSIQLSGGGSTASVYHWPNEDYRCEINVNRILFTSNGAVPDLHRYFRILGQQKAVPVRAACAASILGKNPTIFGQFGQSHGSSRTRRWRHAARGDERSMSLTTVTCRMGGIGVARRGANVHFLKTDESFTRELLPFRGASGRAAGRERRKGISSVFY